MVSTTPPTQRQKTALITGCSSGIGYQLCLELASRNFKVFACARRLEKMNSLKEKYPDNIVTLQVDVSSKESIEKCYEVVKEELIKLDGDSQIPKLDLLWNNAGQACQLPSIDLPDEAIISLTMVNFVAPVRITKIFSQLVINAEGTIAFTGSMLAHCPMPFTSLYSATKAGLEEYVSVLSFEMEPLNVKVIHCTVGGVDTGISDPRQMDPNSIYCSTKECLAAMEVKEKLVEKSKPMACDVFAKKVVDKVLLAKLSTVEVYEGSLASIFSFLGKFAPRWLLLTVFKARYKIGPAWESINRKYVLKKSDKKTI
ncbi:unnamed protein product [Ambrosiozyma monospora]|uniref:Unnamed protein product n=1 Tax=Ambrosiozyma monospora TaxID=43982 RepID=A0A9W7DEU5_AMBMO|nr:unnamed protein product [Ambrosiozyma monospora]